MLERVTFASHGATVFNQVEDTAFLLKSMKEVDDHLYSEIVTMAVWASYQHSYQLGVFNQTRIMSRYKTTLYNDPVKVDFIHLKIFNCISAAEHTPTLLSIQTKIYNSFQR